MELWNHVHSTISDHTSALPIFIEETIGEMHLYSYITPVIQKYKSTTHFRKGGIHPHCWIGCRTTVRDDVGKTSGR